MSEHNIIAALHSDKMVFGGGSSASLVSSYAVYQELIPIIIPILTVMLMAIGVATNIYYKHLEAKRLDMLAKHSLTIFEKEEALNEKYNKGCNRDNADDN